jgi:hypothetical protein
MRDLNGLTCGQERSLSIRSGLSQSYEHSIRRAVNKAMVCVSARSRSWAAILFLPNPGKTSFTAMKLLEPAIRNGAVCSCHATALPNWATATGRWWAIRLRCILIRSMAWSVSAVT